MNTILQRIKTEPTIILGVLEAVLALLLSFGVALSTDQNGAILAVGTAVVGVVGALSVRPFQWPLVKGLVQAVIACVIAFGFDLDPGTQGSIIAVTGFVLAFLTRETVTPETKLPPVVRQAQPYPAGPDVPQDGSESPPTPSDPTGPPPGGYSGSRDASQVGPPPPTPSGFAPIACPAWHTVDGFNYPCQYKLYDGGTPHVGPHVDVNGSRWSDSSSTVGLVDNTEYRDRL